VDKAAPIVIAVITILMSGVVSAIVTYRLNRAKEQSFFMRKKAEELYMAADEFGRFFSLNMVAFLPLLEGKIDYNQMLDVQIANETQKRHGGLELVEMLTRIYFPEVEPKLQDVYKARDRFSEFRAAHKRAYLSDLAPSSIWMPQFAVAMKAVEAATESLKQSIVTAGRKHA
jgi:hypothetical protein